MIITAKNKKKQLRKQYPILKRSFLLWTLSPEYDVLDPSELQDMVNECSVADEKFVKKIKKCNNFALKLMVKLDDFQVKMFELFPEENGTPYSLGIVLGNHKEYGPHGSMVAETTEGTKFIEPQTNEITDSYIGQLYFMLFD